MFVKRNSGKTKGDKTMETIEKGCMTCLSMATHKDCGQCSGQDYCLGTCAEVDANGGKYLYKHWKESNPEEQMKQLIRHVTPFNVKVKRMSIFENEKIDVVKFDVSVDGYVEKDDPKNIFIMADAYHFVKAFKKSVDYLREVVKHETRHSIQIKAEWDGKMKGLPKVGVRDPERDPYGVRKGGEGSRSAHVTRDIEFKPNVHTYAYHLKRYLSRNYPKSRWAEGLTTLLSFRGVFGRDDKAIEIAQMLDELRTTNPEKWRLFMKELYKEVFKNE